MEQLPPIHRRRGLSPIRGAAHFVLALLGGVHLLLKWVIGVFLLCTCVIAAFVLLYFAWRSSDRLMEEIDQWFGY